MRSLIVILALSCAVAASGQIYIDSYRFAASGPSLLLDSFPGAAGAWSFRQLDRDYTGNAIMVQRQSDNDSLNIGFVAGFLDTTSLKTFCAATNCSVRVWYDQSGNNRNARQNTFASMPKIVTSGTIIRSNGLVVMQRDSQTVIIPTNIGLTSQSIFVGVRLAINVNETTTAFNIIQSDSTIATNIIGFGSISGAFLGERHSWLISGTDGAIFGSAQTTTNLNSGNYLFTHMFSQSSPTTKIYKNNIEESLTNSSTGGAYTSTNYPRSFNFSRSDIFTGARNHSLFEVIVYPTFEDTNRSAINTNINNYYSIY